MLKYWLMDVNGMLLGMGNCFVRMIHEVLNRAKCKSSTLVWTESNKPL